MLNYKLNVKFKRLAAKKDRNTKEHFPPFTLIIKNIFQLFLQNRNKKTY